MPTPQTEEPELYPGGADAIADQDRFGSIPDGPVGADLPPQDHPAAGATPDEVAEPDAKQQEPEDDADDPADEGGGDPEPPA